MTVIKFRIEQRGEKIYLSRIDRMNKLSDLKRTDANIDGHYLLCYEFAQLANFYTSRGQAIQLFDTVNIVELRKLKLA